MTCDLQALHQGSISLSTRTMQDKPDILDNLDFTITSAKVGQMLGLSRQTVSRLIAEGKLDAFKASEASNSRWRISRASVIRFVNENLAKRHEEEEEE